MEELWPFPLGFGLVYKCIYLHAFMCKFKKVQLPKLCTCILKYNLRRTTDKKCCVHVGLNHLLLKITCLQMHQKKNQALIPVFTIMHLS